MRNKFAYLFFVMLFISCEPQLKEVELKTIEKVYVCPSCNKEYVTAEEAASCCKLEKSDNENKDVVYIYVCPKCHKEYLNAEDAMNCCGIEIKEVLVEKIEKLYVCPECKKEYITVEEATSCCKVKNTEIESKDIVKVYVCPKCHKEYMNAEDAGNCCGIEIKEVQIERIEKIYVCPNCQKEFSNKEEAMNCCGKQIQYISKYLCPCCNTAYETLNEAVLCCKDEIAPDEIKNVTASNLDGAVLLQWIDPSADDLLGIEISFTPEVKINSRSLELTENSILVSPKTQCFQVDNLTNGIEYTFFLRSVDKKGNKSKGISIKFIPCEIEIQEMNILLTKSISTITNQNVKISITIASNSGIKVIKYIEGDKKIDFVSQNGIDITESKEFSILSNGIYTVYAQDMAGRREIKTIEINNIDKTPPQEVTNFELQYNYRTKKIHASWISPLSDCSKVLLTYKLNNNFELGTKELKSESFEIENIDADGNEYTFIIKTVDSAGNMSQGIIQSIKPTPGPMITSLILSRNHIAYNDTDLTIGVTIKGCNFNLLSEQTDSSIVVMVKNNESVLSSVEAIVDGDTATATILAPALSTSSEAGIDYDVIVALCGELVDGIKSNFNISNPLKIQSIILEQNEISIDSTLNKKIDVYIEGSNIDLAKEMNIQFYTSNNEEYGTCVPLDISHITKNSKKIVTEIEVPTVNDIYVLKVNIDGKIIDKTCEYPYPKDSILHVYGNPIISKVRIPKAGVSRAYNTVSVIVEGKNFDTPQFNKTLFNVTTTSSIITNPVYGAKEIYVLNDSFLTVSIVIPPTTGSYNINFSYQTSSITGDFVINDYSDFTTGDVILKDGSKINYTEGYNFSESEKNNAIAVIYINDYGVPYGVGKYCASGKKWAYEYTDGFNKAFENIICNPTNTTSEGSNFYETGNATTSSFTGDIYGDDNWMYVCKIDKNANDNSETNYPAFYYANNYAINYNLENEFENGWFLPSIAELACIYKNKEILNTVLSNILGNLFTDDYYWSSSQRGCYKYGGNTIIAAKYAWALYFWNGDIYSSFTLNVGGKSFPAKVCVVRSFE